MRLIWDQRLERLVEASDRLAVLPEQPDPRFPERLVCVSLRVDCLAVRVNCASVWNLVPPPVTLIR
jgi:hypothetical protein